MGNATKGGKGFFKAAYIRPHDKGAIVNNALNGFVDVSANGGVLGM
jgi:hypothetical protein